MKKFFVTLVALSLAVTMCVFPAFAADSQNAVPSARGMTPLVAEPSLSVEFGIFSADPQATPSPIVTMPVAEPSVSAGFGISGADPQATPSPIVTMPAPGMPEDMPFAPAPDVPYDMPIAPPSGLPDEDPIAPDPQPSDAPITPAPSISVYVSREMQLMGLIATPDSEGTLVKTLLEIAGQEAHDHPTAFPETGCVFRVLQESGVADSDTVVSTGMKLAQWDGDHEMGAYDIIVMGDVIGTGKMSLTQLVRMTQAVTGASELTGAFLTAGDWNGDGAITLTDLVKESELLRGEIPELPIPKVL